LLKQADKFLKDELLSIKIIFWNPTKKESFDRWDSFWSLAKFE
jgi:hypothetical protein